MLLFPTNKIVRKAPSMKEYDQVDTEKIHVLFIRGHNPWNHKQKNPQQQGEFIKFEAVSLHKNDKANFTNGNQILKETAKPKK